MTTESPSSTEQRERTRIILKSPELCPECNRVFLSATLIKECEDHEGKQQL